MKLNKNTKKAKSMVQAYWNAKYNTIEQLYINPSQFKKEAERAIFSKMLQCNGYDYRVIGGNSCTFSCAFRFMLDDKTEILCYKTAYNTYLIEL